MDKIVIVRTLCSKEELDLKTDLAREDVLKKHYFDWFKEHENNNILEIYEYANGDIRCLSNENCKYLYIANLDNKSFDYFYNILEVLEVPYTEEDISERVLYDQIDINTEFHDWLFLNLRSKFDYFISTHLTVDIVLDKINRYGIDSLTIKDKSLLNGESLPIFFLDL